MRLVGSADALVPDADTDAVCWVCCEGAESTALLSTGCACRGSGGRAHVSCLVASAQHNVARWTSCPTCRQDWTGEMEGQLALARWEGVRARPADDAERLFVANNLAVTLQESAGDFRGAAALLEEVLAVRRATLGDMHPDTLDSMTNLALHHTEAGNLCASLELSQEVVARHRNRQALGEQVTDEEVAHAIGSLAAVHNLMGNGALAEPLHREALAIRERLLGSDHIDTLNSRYGLGRSLVQLGRHEDGFGLLENVSACAHRVFGAKHPTCQHFQRGLASLKQGTGPAES